MTLPVSLHIAVLVELFPTGHTGSQIVNTSPCPWSSSIAYWACRCIRRSWSSRGRIRSTWPHKTKSKRADLRLDMDIGLCQDFFMDIRHDLWGSESSSNKGYKDLEI